MTLRATRRTTPTFAVTSRAVVLKGNYLLATGHASYDVAPGGGFVLVRPVTSAREQIVVVKNWDVELRARTATSAR